MTERLPYEEQLSQQWNELPLPDINMAWTDMKRRLEEDDDKPLLPIWLRGCAGWLLLGLLVAGLGWWIVRPEKWFRNKQNTQQENNPVDKKVNGSDTGFNSTDSFSARVNKEQPGDTNNTKSDSAAVTIGNFPGKDPSHIGKNSNDSLVIAVQSGLINNKQQHTRQLGKPSRPKIVIKKKKDIVNKDNVPVKPNDKEKGEEENETDSVVLSKQPPIVLKDTPAVVIRTTINPDSVQNKKADSVEKKTVKEEVATQPKKDSTKKSPLSFSAGIALHQQLPVDSQTFVPYSAFGRKGSLADYIPSVYIRLNKEGKWFVQSGFRYGAPQLVKGSLYSSKADTISFQKYNTTNAYLKKTFYHQLPLTFNYFVLPGWSLGGGVVWNRFAGAVSSRDIIQTDRFSGLDTFLTSGVIFSTRRADSNFVKSYFQAIAETQYKWKRFSFGASYSFGLQPYIRFVLSNGQPQEQKNRSLQLFIRYELWKAKSSKEEKR